MSQSPPNQKNVLLTHLDWNLQRLDEVLKEDSTDYFKGAALQRFGHTYTMALKSIRGLGNAETITDEECIGLAGKNGWIEDLPQWQEMQTDFKSITQSSTGPEAEAIYKKLPGYQQAFKNLYANLEKLS